MGDGRGDADEGRGIARAHEGPLAQRHALRHVLPRHPRGTHARPRGVPPLQDSIVPRARDARGDRADATDQPGDA